MQTQLIIVALQIKKQRAEWEAHWFFGYLMYELYSVKLYEKIIVIGKYVQI